MPDLIVVAEYHQTEAQGTIYRPPAILKTRKRAFQILLEDFTDCIFFLDQHSARFRLYFEKVLIALITEIKLTYGQ